MSDEAESNQPADSEVSQLPVGDQVLLLTAQELVSAEDVGESQELGEMKTAPRDCSKWQILIYSMGHFYNDLCASLWFTYLIIFLEHVLSFDSAHAGFLMLIGQLTDAVSTVAVSLLSDGNVLPKGLIITIGRRKCWYIFGIFCVTASFSFIFGNCIFCSVVQIRRTLELAPFIMIFQFGWACVQISHLALIPELSSVESTRIKMNSFRYGFTVVANLSVFALLYVLLDKTGPNDGIGLVDLEAFKIAGVIAIGVGTLTTAAFILGLHEMNARGLRQRKNSLRSLRSQISSTVDLSWRDWLSQGHFYQVALMYMFARLFINISQIYFPFYIIVTQKRSKKYVTILPTVGYLASLFVSSVLMPCVGGRINTKGLFLVGSIVAMTNCALMYFPLPGLNIYDVSILLGVAQSMLLISSLSITATLINRNTESSAFVYGSMSFLDKLSSGIICQIVEIFSAKCAHAHCDASCVAFYRNVIVFVPGISALAIFFLLTVFDQKPIGADRSNGGRQLQNNLSGNYEDNDSPEI